MPTNEYDNFAQERRIRTKLKCRIISTFIFVMVDWLVVIIKIVVTRRLLDIFTRIYSNPVRSYCTTKFTAQDSIKNNLKFLARSLRHYTIVINK